MATVTNETQLRAAVQSGTDPEVLVANDMTVRTFVTVNRSVTIRTVPGNPTATLFWAPSSGVNNQYMFRVYSLGNLTTDMLTMDGEGRNCGLVRVSGGVFTMNDGVTMTGIQSNTSNSAVLVGDMTSTVGGTFMMNGGLITGVDAGPHTVVFCAGGTVAVSGGAAIENNSSAALIAMHNIADGTRSNVRITGNARISNNRSGQSGAGVVVLNSDAVIGENDSDAPIISGNYSPFNAGGILMLEESEMAIGGRTEISGNSSLLACGGILLSTGSTLRIGGNVKVKDNKSGANCGGIGVAANSALVLEDRVEVSGNTAGDETIAGGAGVGDGGGVMLQTGASLVVKGNVSIHGNTARNGGGINLLSPPDGSAYGPPTLIIGAEDSSPSVYENTAANHGGGIFIADRCTATLTGQASVYDNEAVQGKGVYNGGIFKVADSPNILDGLFFECVLADSYQGSLQKQSTAKLRIESGDPGFPAIEYDTMMHDIASAHVQETGDSPSTDSASGLEPLQCDRAPIVDEPLTQEALLHVESSGHVAPPNVPLVIAVGDSDTIPLTENDRAAWRIPSVFGPGYAVMLTPGLDQVIIDVESYDIVYNDLHGATCPNPTSYSIESLPITFAPPSERTGYTFAGWRDAAGSFVTGISEGTTGDLTYTAVWQAQVYTIVYNDLQGATCPNPTSYSIESLPITFAPPSERAGYAFAGWLDLAGNPVTEISEGTTGDLTFTAVWQVQAYRIVYLNLFGATHMNPASYNVENLPIPLSVPSERAGYAFAGWRDAAGNPATEIPRGTTGDLTFTAAWAELSLSFNENAPCVCHVPPIIRAVSGVAQIPNTRPCRRYYAFLGWNESASGSGKAYCPCDRVHVSGKNLTLYAQWRYVGCR